MTDYEKIFEDVINLQNKYWTYGISNFNCIITDSFIGKEKIRIDKDHYYDIYDEINEKNKFCAELSDGSLVTFEYHFNSDGSIKNYCISFLPNPLSETLFKDPSLENIISLYFRVDYTEEGHNGILHSLIHFHNSVERDGLRIGVKESIYPSKFIYDIETHILGIDIEKIKSLWLHIQDLVSLDANNPDPLIMHLSF